jgi:cytoskeletal protein CcmA (bactofilin family)
LYGILKGKAIVDNLYVSKTAKLIGDATHNSIAIEPGAYIDGHCMRADAANSLDKKKAEVIIVETPKMKSKAKAG